MEMKFLDEFPSKRWFISGNDSLRRQNGEVGNADIIYV